MRFHKKLAVFSFAVLAGLGGFLSLLKYQQVIAEAVFAGRNQVTAALTGVTLNNGSVNLVAGTDISSETTALSPDTGAYTWTRDGGNYMALNMPFNLGATQTDFSGNGNTGTAVGTVTFTTSGCKVGGCMVFDGSTGGWDTGPSATTKITGPLTVAAWVKFNSLTGPQMIASNTQASGIGASYVFYFDGNALRLSQNSGSLDATSTGTITDTNWHHVAMTRSGTTGSWTIRFYIDGALDSTFVTAVNPNASPTNLFIGKHGSYPTGYRFNGTMDEVYVFPFALDTAQISQLRTDGLGLSQNASDGVGGPTIIQSEETAAGQLWDLSITPIASDGTVGTLLPSTNPVLIVSGASNLSGSLDSPDEGSPLISSVTIPVGSTAGYRWVANNVNISAFVLPFNSGASQVDVSGTANHGTLQNGALFTTTGCKVGGCLSLDGIDDYVSITDVASLNLTGSQSVSAWIKPSSLGVQNVIYSRWGPTDHQSVLNLASGLVRYSVRTTAAATVTRDSSVTVTTGNWYHVLGVYNATATTLDIYVNGVLSNGALSGTVPSSLRNPTVGVPSPRIGFKGDGTTEVFAGLIDEVYLYPRALSAAQIYQLYQDGNTGLGGPTRISAQEHTLGETWELIAAEFLSDGTVGPEFYVDSATISAAAVTTVTPVAPLGTQDRDITIGYTCSNADNTGRDLLVEYSTNGGGTYASASLSSTTSGTITGSYIFGSTCNGSLQSLVWDSLTDLVATGVLDSDVRIRLTVQIGAVPSGDTGNFSVQNPFVLSSPTTVNSGDTTYDGSDVICSGATTLTINGSHSFDSLELLNGCTLTHSANTTLQTNFAVLTISGDMTIDATSSINLNGKGFQGGQTRCTAGAGPGAGQPGTDPGSGSFFHSGGASYGGRGGTGNNTSVASSYGSPTQPTDLGSGGAGGGEYLCNEGTTTGGAGGGAIKIVGTGTITMDGTISANGAIGTSLGGGSGTGAAGGGAGGSVWLDFATIAGSGAIYANGANATSSGGGSGGGGRIAVYYNTNNHSNLAGSVFAAGGAATNTGSAGTIYLKPNADNFGDLVMTNSGGASQYTTLLSGVTQFDTITILDAANVVYTPATLEFDETITIGGSTATRFALSGTTVTSTTGTAAIVINNNGILSHDLNTTARTNYIDIAGIQDLTINTGGSVNVDGRGYRGGTTRCQAGSGPGAGQPGTDPGSGSFFSSGGASYGGRGGTGNNSNVATSYGSPLEPVDLGSGGAGGGEYLCDQGTTTGGAGGGAIKIVGTGTITVDGTISANGAIGTSLGGGSGTGAAGGGAGGSVWLGFATIAGSGAVSANGANATSSGGGAGGGGRVAIYYTTNSHVSLTTSTTARGGSLANAGGAGTIYFKSSGDNFGDLQFSNGGTVGQYTTLFTGATQFDLLTVLDGANVIYQPITLEVDELITIGGTATTTFAVSNTAVTSTTGTADIVINSNGVLSHNTNTTTQVNDLEVSGFRHATVNSGGSINVVGKGFQGGSRCADGSGTGGGKAGPDPGSGSAFPGGGGTYGGRGGNGQSTNYANFYGSITAPALLGSGGAGGGSYGCGSGTSTGGAGGGYLKLVLSGTLTVNGSINANGGAGTTTIGQAGGGSGGSIWVDVDTIAGSGTISADGGNPSSAGGGAGGGGRIAIYYDTNTHSNLIGSLSIAGGSVSNYGSSGTAFIKQNTLSNGDLKLDNNNFVSAHFTNLFVTGQPSTYTVRDLYVIEQAKLLIDSPCSGTPAVTVTGTTYLTSSGTITNNQSGTCTLSQVPINITTTTLSSGIVSSAYSQTIQASGGYAPYTFVVLSGSLPPGLSLSSAGVISGTPTTLGDYAFTVRGTDGSAPAVTDDQAFTMTVGNAPDAPTSLFSHSSDAQTCCSSATTDATPVFSAIFDDSDVGNTATKYQIQVASDAGFTTLLWNSSASGTSMASTDIGSRSPNINYAGSALTLGGVTYYWRIKFWDNTDIEGPFSATATFTTSTAPTAPTTLFSNDGSAQTGLTNPAGVTSGRPNFSAVFNDPDIGDIANKYRIQVDDNNDFSSVVWDSGAAGTSMTNCNEGARCVDIAFGAITQLEADESVYFWRIKFFDQSGVESPWSQDPISTNKFTMGTGGSSQQRITDLQQQNQEQQEQESLPAAPQAVSVEVLGSTTLRYNWLDNSNNETGFRLLDANDAVIADVPFGTTSAQEINLAPNTQVTGRKVVAYNAVGQSSPSEFGSAVTSAPDVRPRLLGRTQHSVTFSIEPAFSSFPGDTAIMYEILVTRPRLGVSQLRLSSEWIQTNEYTFEGIEADDEIEVRVTTRNQAAISSTPTVYEEMEDLSRRFAVTLGVFKKATNTLPRPLAANESLEVSVQVQNVGSLAASNVLVSLPLPRYIVYRGGTLTVDGRGQSDGADQDAGQAGGNAVSAIWSQMAPNETHTLRFELAFDEAALNRLRPQPTPDENLAQAAANPIINLQVAVSFAESEDVYMSPVVSLEPDVTTSEPIVTPEPEPIPEEPVPLPTPEEVEQINDLINQIIQQEVQENEGDAGTTPPASQEPEPTTVSSDGPSFNVEVKNDAGDSLSLTGMATSLSDQIQFTGTTSQPFTLVTLIFNNSVTAIVVSDANGNWKTFVSADQLGIKPGQEASVTIEAIASKGDLRSERVQVGEVKIALGRSGDIEAEFDTTVSSNATLTVINEVRKEVVRVIEEQQPVIQTTLSVTAPVVVISSVPLWGYLPYVPTMIYHLLTYLLGLIGRKKKGQQRFYGVVYDSITKLTLPLAIVRIYSSLVIPNGSEGSLSQVRKLISTTVTDKLGRYEALLAPGKYTLEVTKPTYQFPSQIVTTEVDANFHIYKSQDGMTIGEQGTEITVPDVPLDPVNAQRQWQLTSGVKKVWLAIQKVGNYLAVPVLLVGSIASVVTVAAVPDKGVNWLLAIMYVLLLAAQLKLRPKLIKAWGVVYDIATNAVLPLTTIQLIDPQYGKVVTSRLSDYEGRFSFLPEPGSYAIKASKPGYEQVKEVVESPQSNRQPMKGDVQINKPDERISGDLAMKQVS